MHIYLLLIYSCICLYHIILEGVCNLYDIQERRFNAMNYEIVNSQKSPKYSALLPLEQMFSFPYILIFCIYYQQKCLHSCITTSTHSYRYKFHIIEFCLCFIWIYFLLMRITFINNTKIVEIISIARI